MSIDNFANSCKKWKDSLQLNEIQYTNVIFGMIDIFRELYYRIN
jgi:hypothetical protein